MAKKPQMSGQHMSNQGMPIKGMPMSRKQMDSAMSKNTKKK